MRGVGERVRGCLLLKAHLVSKIQRPKFTSWMLEAVGPVPAGS